MENRQEEELGKVQEQVEERELGPGKEGEELEQGVGNTHVEVMGMD